MSFSSGMKTSEPKIIPIYKIIQIIYFMSLKKKLIFLSQIRFSRQLKHFLGEAGVGGVKLRQGVAKSVEGVVGGGFISIVKTSVKIRI